jgi:methylthioribose-1-phosphate isomerase
MTQKQSPLFIPALWEGSRFRILDETLLPWKVEYITVHEISEALQAVKEMKTRAFGQVLTFLYAAALVSRRYTDQAPEPLRQQLTQLAEEFTRARPTFDFNGLLGLFHPWFSEMPAGNDAGKWIENKIHEFVAAVPRLREERARRAAEMLPNPCRLLTHCNVSGEIVAVAQWCEAMGKELRVVATETRPYLQGSRLTAWEISRAGVKVDLIPDCAIAQVMAGGKIDAVLVGADRSAQNGDIINKVGTYPIAVVAREYGVPFYALVQDPGMLERGGDSAIEERPAAELFQLQGRSLLPVGAVAIEGRYPAFDVTPAALISRLIGFDGSYTPESFRRKFQQGTPAAQDGKEPEPSYLLLYGIPRRSSYAHLAHAFKVEKAQHFLLPEMRPELWGLHLVAKELRDHKIPLQLISDNMMGTFFAQGLIRRLYLFYSEVGAQGAVGICGSLLAVILARAQGVPVELLASEAVQTTLPDRDVSTFMQDKVIPDGVAIYPVEREIIPWSLFKEGKAGGA